MIKAIIKQQDTNKPVIILGLSDMNIQKLKEGKPIHIKLKELGMDGEVLIFNGKTEESMINDLKGHGLIL